MKHIAVRLKRFDDSTIAFGYNKNHKNKRQLIDANIEKRDPALRNLVDGLLDRGMEFLVDGCRLFWLQIDDDNSLEYYQSLNEVECVFYSDWFEEKKKSIRYRHGASYVQGCLDLADHFEIKDQSRKIDYEIVRRRPIAL